MLDKPPECYSGKAKLKGRKAAGVRYEKLVARRLRKRISAGTLKGCTLKAGQWYKFRDRNGNGLCQTDIELHFKDFIILLECKLTQTDSAVAQLLDLYVPVLEDVHRVPVIPVQVCKNLRYHPDNLIRDISVILARPSRRLTTWHYLAKH